MTRFGKTCIVHTSSSCCCSCNGLVPSTRAVYCTQNKHTSISIHTFVTYAKEVSGYKVMQLVLFVLLQNNFSLHCTGRHFFEVITDISSNAESHEKQNIASSFLIEATTAKLLKACRRKGRRKISFLTYVV